MSDSMFWFQDGSYKGPAGQHLECAGTEAPEDQGLAALPIRVGLRSRADRRIDLWSFHIQLGRIAAPSASLPIILSTLWFSF